MGIHEDIAVQLARARLDRAIRRGPLALRAIHRSRALGPLHSLRSMRVWVGTALIRLGHQLLAEQQPAIYPANVDTV